MMMSDDVVNVLVRLHLQTYRSSSVASVYTAGSIRIKAESLELTFSRLQVWENESLQALK